MTDVRALAQSTLDTALNGAVHVHWQRKISLANEQNPDEYVVFTLGSDRNRKYADNAPLYKDAGVTIRYYYRVEMLETAAGRSAIKARENTILTALLNAGFFVLSGPFDAGDIDDVGCFTTIIECGFGRVV